MKRFGKFFALVSAIFAFAACETAEEETPFKLDINPSELTFEASGGSQEITLSATNRWHVEITEGGDWLGVDKSSGEAGEGQKVTITAWDNSAEESRTGEILFHSGGGAATLTITQQGLQEVIPEGPELPVATKANTYVLNGREQSFRATAFMMVGENPAVMATTQLGVSGAEAILASNNFFYGAVNPLLEGAEFDVMTESSVYTFISTLMGATIETLAPTMTEEVTAGKACLKIEGEVATLTAGLILADGTTLAVNISAKAEEEIEINENVIKRGNERKPIRASFYMAEGGNTFLYFTSAGIEYAEELDIAIYYMYLMLGDELLTGRTIDLSSGTLTDDNFMLGLMDNADSSASWGISGSTIGDSTGTIIAKRNEEGNYSVILDVTVGGVEYYISFEGACRSCYDEPVVETNYLIVDGEKMGVSSATLDRRDEGELCDITFGVEGGRSVVATLPKSCLDGNAYGFSQSDDFAVTYGEVTFSPLNGDRGTIIALLDEETLTLEFSFMNYAGFEISYSGAVTIYE